MAQKKWVLYSAMIFYIKKTSRRNTDNNEGNITKFPVHSFFFFQHSAKLLQNANAYFG